MRQDLTERVSLPEIMDDLNCSGSVVIQTLQELDTINRLLGGNNVTISGLDQLLTAHRPEGEIIIADLGSGSGAMLEIIDKWCSAQNIRSKFIGFDANPNIVAYARKEHPSNDILFKTADVLSDQFREERFDIAMATLFLHHFSHEQLVALLKSLKQQARIGIIVNDIHRHWLAYHSIQLLTRWFSKSTMVKYDAPLSVRRAFRKQEIVQIMKEAEISNYELTWKWAFRWQLVISTGLA